MGSSYRPADVPPQVPLPLASHDSHSSSATYQAAPAQAFYGYNSQPLHPSNLGNRQPLHDIRHQEASHGVSHMHRVSEPHISQHHHAPHHFPPPQIQPPPSRQPRQDSAPSNSIVTAPSASARQGGIAHPLSETFSKVDEATGRKYQLDVVQQPRRARMCGFGDKDRRPITPPPCVRLIITDLATGKEVDCNDIDHSMFVLNVDLWNEDGTREVNLVRSSTGSPSISSTTPYSYLSLNGGDASMAYPEHNREPHYGPSHASGSMHEYHNAPMYGQASSYGHSSGYSSSQPYLPSSQGYRADGGISTLPSQSTMSPYGRNGSISSSYSQDSGHLARIGVTGAQPQGMFTRNLIGSLAASAFRLNDTDDHIGVWFILQDLSVRTEGPFRLRFSFVNVGPPDAAPHDAGSQRVNKSRATIWACCFSDVFHVYSAKKFPGVCESTPLSKTFATQGIKIPIRKDTNVKGGDEDDYGD